LLIEVGTEENMYLPTPLIPPPSPDGALAHCIGGQACAKAPNIEDIWGQWGGGTKALPVSIFLPIALLPALKPIARCPAP